MKKILKFILVGLIFSLPGEIVNQIYNRHSVKGFFVAMVNYTVFLFVLFFVRKAYNTIVKQEKLNLLLWYLSFGVIGLAIEWLFLGTKSQTWYIQIGMFTFWASICLMPVIFTEKFKGIIKENIIRYCLVWIPLFLIVGLANTFLGLAIWLWGTIFLNYFIFCVFVL